MTEQSTTQSIMDHVRQHESIDPFYSIDTTHDNIIIGNCDGEVYLFKEWTSSTGLLFTILLLYIGLVTITNIIVLYKFIATWNRITVSLREQNRVCAKYAANQQPMSRRQTCEEALRPCKYECNSNNDASIACPICLIDIQNQDYVVSCDDGCATKFHQNCLYTWLEYNGNDFANIGNNTDNGIDTSCDNHTSCPCCRKELIGIVYIEPTTATATNATNASSGFISDLSTLVGYYPY